MSKEEYTKEEVEKLQQIKKKGIGNSIRNVRMGDRKMSDEETETLRRFDLWFAIKLHTNNHIPFIEAVLKTESNDFKRGWTMAMVMVSQWLTDVANGHYDTDKHDLKFDILEALQDKWNKLHEKEKGK